MRWRCHAEYVGLPNKLGPGLEGATALDGRALRDAAKSGICYTVAMKSSGNGSVYSVRPAAMMGLEGVALRRRPPGGASPWHVSQQVDCVDKS
jgi:hypothetical protein